VKFIVSYTIPQSTLRAAEARFLGTGGMPPANVTLIGRWHGMNGNGVAIVETNDPKALYSWFADWLEFLPLNITPCLEDADAGAVLKALNR
jgi:hypothetical protein